MIQKIGEYYLNMPVREMFDLKELGPAEYKSFETAGITKIFKDERIYHGKALSLFGVSWDTLLSATEGRLYKISLQAFGPAGRTADETHESVYYYIVQEMGKPSKTEANRYIWDAPEGNVFLSKRSLKGMHSVQFLLTSRSIGKQTEAIEEVAEASKKANQNFGRMAQSSLEGYSEAEIQRWLKLRALEWVGWPGFLSQAIVPVLFIFLPALPVIAGFLAIDFIWCFVRHLFVSPMLSRASALFIAFLKWPIVIGSSIFLFFHRQYGLVFLSLAWPIIGPILSLPINFLAGRIGPRHGIGTIELALAKGIGNRC